MKRSSAQQNYTKELVKRLRTNVETGKDIEKSILSIQNDHLSNLVFDLEQNILNLRREKQDLEDESKKLDDQLDKAFTFAAQLYNKPKEVLKKSFQKNIDYDNDKFIPFPELFDELADREGAARLSKIDFEKLNLIFKIESLNYKKELEAKEKLRVEAKIQKKDRRIGKLADNLVNYGFPILKDFGDKAEKESSHGQSQSHPEDSINSTVTNTINGSLNTTTNLDLHRSSPIDGENETKRSKKEQLDLLKKRQEEINSYTKQIEELKRKIHETQQITKSKEHKNQNSSETKDFIAILTTLKTDYLKFRDTYDQNRQELSMHWLENFTNLNKIKMEDANCQKNFKTQIIHYEQRNLKLKRENDALKLEIEKIQAGLNHGETIKKETRQLIESYKENIKTMQSQIDRNREISDKFKKILEITEKEEVELKQQEEAKKMKEEEELKAKEENLIKRIENYKNELLAKKEAQSVKIENDENQDGKDEKEVKVEASETVDEVDRNRSDSVTFGLLEIKSESKTENDLSTTETKIEEITINYQDIPLTEIEEQELAQLEEKSLTMKKEAQQVKLLLDCYKHQPEDCRKKVESMVAENKLKQELESLNRDLEAICKSETYENWFKKMKVLNMILMTEDGLINNDHNNLKENFETIDGQNKRLLSMIKNSEKSDNNLYQQHTKFNEKQKSYAEEREKMISEIENLQNIGDGLLKKIDEAENKERMNMQLLKENNKDLEYRLAAIDEHSSRLIESTLIDRFQKSEVDRIGFELNGKSPTISTPGLLGTAGQPIFHTGGHLMNPHQSQPPTDLSTGLDYYRNDSTPSLSSNDHNSQPNQPTVDQTPITNAQKIENLSKNLETAKATGQKLDEKILNLQRKNEKLMKNKGGQIIDEDITAEIQRMKEKVQCSLCRINDKNAILVNCKHLYCIDCLQQRYDTRQRQCPKCNSKFGLNEFKSIHF